MTSQGIDACLRLLADRRRRQVIRQLRHEADGTVTFDDLVDQLLRDGTVTGDDQLRDREQLAVQLQHTHLPKLADHGVVEYERRSGAVRYRPSEPVERVLDTLPGEVSIPDP